ncbi:hypothetical protein C5708_05060 [Caulobacter sp. CCUG 60055]|uniref:hypothetical protein n=1 Tax=Caulobacter sp. CCUG 60055 TaxID=2100090 RepID=UPI001FA6C315|nr:hypothetical protein [Caulobacter sp. CCUG 60055]MCI3179617.1 hypothetical protein [Caulobacter sp. CCUG 60055]
MIVERTLMALAAAAAVAAAAAISVAAAAFALYALLQGPLSSAGAAAVVAAVFALVVAVAGFFAARKTEGRDRHAPKHADAAGLIDLAMNLVRDKPVVSAGAAIAAGLIALRNPQLVGVVLRAFMDGRSPPKS